MGAEIIDGGEVVYKYEEAFKKSKEYFKGEELPSSVFLNKYALRDANQILLEAEPTQMFNRLASEFARIEKKKFKKPLTHSEIYEYLKDFNRIVPQGSPMSGVGNPYQYTTISNCFASGTRTLTNNGVRNIEDVQVGDKVVSHCGNLQEVEHTHSNINGRQVFSVKCFRTPSVKVTDDHRFWSITQEQLEWKEGAQWNSISHLRKGDYISIPNRKQDTVDDCSCIDLLQEMENNIEKDFYSYKEVENQIILTSHWIGGQGAKCKRDHKPINKVWEIDKDFCFFIGLWYGDGCIFSDKKKNKYANSGNKIRGITFTFGDHEKEIIKFVKNYGEKLFGFQADVNDNSEIDGTVQIVFHSFLIGTMFELFFGRGCKGKKVYNKFYNIRKEYYISLIAGIISSDGTITKEGDVRVVMNNADFIEEIYHLSRSYGFLLGITRQVDNRNNYSRLDFPKNSDFIKYCKKQYGDNRVKIANSKEESKYHIISIDGNDFVRIDNKEKINYIGNRVYCIEVKEDHSFSVEGLLCENCYVVESPLDAYGGICRTDEHIVQISKRRGGVGTDLSNLRPDGSPTTNAARSSTGVLTFMERYSNSIREVGQSGRRGALMLSISIHHPEAVGFARVKRDLKKVTGANISIRLSDEFLEAVKKGTKYEQRFPVDAKTDEEKQMSQMVDAREVWMEIIENAHATAEPGLLFWDKIISESPADCYADFGFRTTSTNPCLSGDTLIYVADGRGNIPIKQLAEEGKDVPVFCYDDKGKIIIRQMRNPRVTGYKKKIYKLTLEDGYKIKATENHKFRLSSGEYKQLKDIKVGDSIKTLTRYEASLKDIFPKCNSNSQNYLWVNDGKTKNLAEHRIIATYFHKRKIKKGEIVHHKDYNAQNNTFSNLEIMTKKEHDKLHSFDMKGSKNPYHRMSDEWKFNFASHPAESNPNFSGISNSTIKDHALNLTLQLGRRFSKKEWMRYAKRKNIVAAFSEWRRAKIGSILELSQWASTQCSCDYIEKDPRLVKTWQKAIEQNYEARIEKNKVVVNKKCEYCGQIFSVNYFRREIGFCSRQCSNYYLNEKGTNLKRTETINNTYSKKAEKTREKQLDMFTSLRFELNREPILKEWEKRCKEKGISFRSKTKYGFDSFKELKEVSLVYNHRVVSVEECGYEDVYNGTVDDFHNFFIGGFEGETRNGKHKFLYINNLQCGELPLCPYDSCRLLLLNLYGYVKNPFTKEAYFDYDYFISDAKIAQRFMDDLIDIEIEKIDRIIKKVYSDPEPIEIKRIEVDLWRSMRKACETGRRTGTGITALGDVLAALGIKYGSKKSIETAEEIYKTLKLACYRSSVEMAKELGYFEVWDAELEKDNAFLLRIKEEDPELYVDMNKYGRRNISLLTTAPAGCLEENSKIKTDRGIISLKDLFELNNINIEDLREKHDLWFSCDEEIYVYDVDHNKHKINKLYWKGYTNGYDFSFSSEKNIKTSNEHKFLVQVDENTAEWKKAADLKINDKIVKLIEE